MIALPATVRAWLRRIGGNSREAEMDPKEVEELRTDFQFRYHHFKLLLNANNKALEEMAEIEEALRGTRPFGMTFVRSHCTEVSTSVFQMIKHLNQLAPDRYAGLGERFKAIQRDLWAQVNPLSPRSDAPLVLALDRITADDLPLVGSKTAQIGEIRNRIGLPTPDGFAVTVAGHERFLAHRELRTEIHRRIQATDTTSIDRLHSLSADLQQLVIRAPVPADLEAAIVDQYHRLEARRGSGVRVALRSSALGEDQADTSFAGLFRSELNVSAEHLLTAYKEVVASQYGLQAVSYRLSRGIREEDAAMSVGVMTMVDAVAGGVVYSMDPVQGDRNTLEIHSVWGLPKPVVDGNAACDRFVISRTQPLRIVERTVAVKTQKYLCYPEEGVCRLDTVGAEAEQPSLTDEQALRLAEIAMGLEVHYRKPVDIEWGITTDGSVIVLQCRPLQQAVSPGQDQDPDRAAPILGAILMAGGITVSPGAAAGPVYLARKDADALAFPEGAVLVVSQPAPRWATLVPRAAAIVAEQGSTAGHLASVAREFRIPALFALPQALEGLPAGAMVTVHADARRIYQGRLGELVKEQANPLTMPTASPVYRTLQEAGRLITPLNLLDPDAPEFRPDHCRTLHDITRFCHEQAVHEMFQFGNRHRFPQRASKQLVCQVPMQFWVINLDDGFHEEVNEAKVHLKNIASIPMLALWQGMIAVPWAGPPPVDTRGFMSVLMEATVNPGLDPASGSPYTVRNYFLVSRHFCSLQSRFGFHFCSVEALVSERTPENYVSFQFKGGAADAMRRRLRARLVAELLEEVDFRTEVKEDATFARIEGQPQAVMESRLRTLGYLIIHTRQLDMVMANGASTARYRNKIRQDLQQLEH